MVTRSQGWMMIKVWKPRPQIEYKKHKSAYCSKVFVVVRTVDTNLKLAEWNQRPKRKVSVLMTLAGLPS